MEDNGFIRQAIEDLKPLLIDSGFQNLKLDAILTSLNISKTKFFRYFGSMGGIMELTVYHELSACYRSLALKIRQERNKEHVLYKIIAHRKKFIDNNPILHIYYATKKRFTRRFEPLKKAVVQNENDLLHGMLAQCFYSEADIAFFKQNITNEI
ncbi:TetR/AcrR family transcriptional regulator [Sphingobacterium paramultivorum]|uniref:TetR/AcrR family transcriptional regulator n=1 Tax=Sphingobacterium paramultivorum TaxID=2886510 RepID=A0A7G5DWX1_9SPHI|nr:TetR/AcrR family transcriptional regulator [Sphingobacterium paramultivorum]QMV66246.1 TetR/AcrR family transcriptional regulator [Sphingobacterium paramultivorum]WSO15025.1 TetR/AcrR family transcriptional regulator [Sphingobacterium paramultivorum]